MSYAMLQSVIRMPFDIAMKDHFSRLQFYQRAQQALSELEALQAKLAEQKPVAWTSAEIMSGPSFVDDDDYAVMYKTKSHLLDDFCGYPEATPVPLYTHPTPSYQGILDNSNHIPDASKMVVPEGWRLVPVEPTEKMLKKAFPEIFDIDGISKNDLIERYQAMLAEAPKYTGDSNE